MSSDLGGKGGRLTSFSDRKEYGAFIEEAIENGARQKLACELVGITDRTYQRWNQNGKLIEDRRINNQFPVHNKLSQAIRQEIINVINKPMAIKKLPICSSTYT